MFDLRWNYPVLGTEGAVFADYLRGLPADAAMQMMRPVALDERAVAAGVAYLGRQRLRVPVARTFLLAGGHHALSVILTLLRLDGGKCAVEALTYSNFLQMAASRGVEALACAEDGDGITPDGLRAAAAAGARAVYLMPTVNNPTGAVMPLARRKELAAVVREAELWVIEDDAYAFLEAAPPTAFAALVPERTFYVSSLSKPFAPGLKAALMCVPEEFASGVAHAGLLFSSGTSALFADFARKLFESGTLEDFVLRKRMDAAERQDIARRMLPGCRVEGHWASYHLWVHPHGRDAAAVCAEAERQGVVVSPGAAFVAPGERVPNAFRVALGAEPERARLVSGLEILRRVLAG